MAYPEKPERDYSYTAFQESQGDNSFPGTQLDNDLANLKESIDETIDFLSGTLRSDGKLANGSVTKASLDETLLLGLAPPRAWATAIAYAVDDTVFTTNTLYICVVAHTADVFATDLAAGRWQAYATFEPLSNISDGSVTTTKLVDAAVTTPKLADAAVTTPKLADATIPAAKLTLAVQAMLTPIGAEIGFSGPFPPLGWLFKAGQPLSRVTYALLFSVLCPAMLVTATNGSPTLTNVPVNMLGGGLEGTVIEGTGIPPGAVIVSLTATTITISANATASNAGIQIRLFPNGNGDGATTFNLPDDRDRVEIGRGNMAGEAAGRVTTVGDGNSGINTSRLGAAGGVDRHAVSQHEMPSHGHGGNVAIIDPGHSHGSGDGRPFQTIGDGTSAPDYIGGAQATFTTDRTASSATGITAALTITATGGSAAHQNVQPSRVTNKIIFTGVV